jgi:exo-beta-1,3-glucanase (GH17 family)
MRNALVAVVVALATALHAGAWLMLHESVSPPNANGALASVSFSPISPNGSASARVTEAQIKSDLAAIAPYTQHIRTYSATNGLEQVPALASKFGLRLTQGVWLNDWEEQNEREMESAISLAKQYRNIDSIVVGNETIYRAQALATLAGEQFDANAAVKDLIAKIQRVKRSTSVPVTTAEVYNVWLEHPELVSAVDYLAVHILPYWEGIPGSAAVDHTIGAYEKLRQTKPRMPILVWELV